MINIAVIGIGRMGYKHAKNLAKRVKGAKLCAVADLSEDRLNLAKRELKVNTYSDYKEMLDNEKLDAVVIATPHYAHLEIAKECMQKDINVLCEKPICVTTKMAQEMLDVYKQHPYLICAMMYNQRTNRMYKKAKQLIESKAIGNVQRVNYTITNWYRAQFYYNMGGWRASWKNEGGGTLINQCVHQLDLIQWLLGMPQSIKAYCYTKGREITTENDVSAIFRFKDFDCLFSASTHENPGENRLVIAGDKGIIVIGSRKMKYRINKLDEPTINSRAKRDYGNSKDKGGKTNIISYGLFNLIRDGIRGQQCNILENFVEALTKNDKSIVIAPLEEGIKALSIINAINMSSWQNEEINIPFDKDKYEELLREKIEQESK